MVTPEQIDIIKTTWKLPAANPVDSGEVILLKFFENYPHNQQKFLAFKNLPFESLKGSKAFRTHAGRVVTVINDAIVALDSPDVIEQLEEMWGKIGKEKSAKILSIPPDGFYFDDLKQCHVEQINSTWSQRFTGSYDFLSNCIALNPSTGIFNKGTEELVAWVLMLETGANGHLLVDEKYRRKRFGEIVLRVQNVKTRKIRCDTVGFVAHQNKASQELSKGFITQWIDNLSWIGIRPKQSTIAIPLWGRL